MRQFVGTIRKEGGDVYSLLLAIIYIAFISLGLPDSLLGSAWPTMQPQMGVPLSYAGIVSMVIAGGTIISSLLSDRLTKRFGAGLVTAMSVLATAVALFGFSTSSEFWMLCLWAIPYGLGAGAVDAALNNYVAVHYASRHMNWLHCFWGVGASISPYIMGYCLQHSFGWHGGYRVVSVLQIGLTLILFLSLPLWKKRGDDSAHPQADHKVLSLPQILRIKGVKYILVAFFAYCAAEVTTGLWAASFLVHQRGIDANTAASFASLFYLGITGGRFVSGFIADKVGDKNMIRVGISIMLVGVLAVWLPLGANWLCLGGLVVIGVGCAPVYPCIIHSTPRNFGVDNSQAIVGVQMASAYTGSTLAPPLFGLIAGAATLGFLPAFILVFAVLMLVMTELLNRIVVK